MHTYEIQLASDRRAFRKGYAYDRARLIAPTRVTLVIVGDRR